MIRIVIQKIKNKLALSLSMLLGMLLLVAIFSCKPVFQNASLNRLLESTFTEYIEANNTWPTVLSRQGSYTTEQYSDTESMLAALGSYQEKWEKYFAGISTVAEQNVLALPEETSQGSFGSKGNYLSISYMPELENHSRILTGTDYFNADNAGDIIPCIISQGVMDTYGFCVDETIDFIRWENSSGETLKLYITGIFKEADETDLFWNTEPNEFENAVFVAQQDFQKIIDEYGCDEITYSKAVLLDYTDITEKNAEDVTYYIEQFKELDKNFDASFLDMMTSFQADRKRIDLTLWVLELPILGMLLAFNYMVAKQIVQTEQDEIAALKSRGFSRKQVAFIYMLQLAILETISFLAGIPLGVEIARLAHITTDFLTFSGGHIEMCRFTPVMLIYGLAAVIISFLFVLIPVIKSTKVSIVERKSAYKKRKGLLWEKYFIDVVLLGVSIYFMINFGRQSDSIRADALAGTKMDPLMFVDAVLFLFAAGLVILRLIHYLVRLINRLGNRRFGPAAYASFLQITRSFDKQGFISVFLILTVALGLFHANIARTINQNNEERIIYDNGADVVFQESWEMEKHVILEDSMTKIVYNYVEPDYAKYNMLIQNGLCDSITRVVENNELEVSVGDNKVKGCMLQGIHTREFGETAYLDEKLYGDTHWYNTLNDLAAKSNGVIISSNLAKLLSLQVGDRITCTKYSELGNDNTDVRGSMSGYVCAIVDAWPGYSQYYYENGEEKERYLVVANYATVVQNLKLSPYRIWCRLADNVSSDKVYQTLTEILQDNGNGAWLEEFTSTSDDIESMKERPMIQITNGMFTLSFIVALLLCMTGFLIYWITTIRQRELLFGVYRAMGMSVHEINYMLINEHIFSTLLSVFAGAFSGMLASKLFASLFALVYLPEKHNMQIFMCFRYEDILKLAIVIFIMIVICLLILRRIVKSMNITQALKLGED